MSKNSTNPTNPRKSSYIMDELRNFNEIFREDVTYHNIKNHKKPGLYPLSKRCIFGKPQKRVSNWHSLQKYCRKCIKLPPIIHGNLDSKNKDLLLFQKKFKFRRNNQSNQSLRRKIVRKLKITDLEVFKLFLKNLWKLFSWEI